MSSVDPKLHFGLGATTVLDSIQIKWPNGNESVLRSIAVNQILRLSPEEILSVVSQLNSSLDFLFTPSEDQLPVIHQESDYSDFDQDRLRFWMISNEGPKAIKADVNGDGLEDIFFPGAKGFPSKLYFQELNGGFSSRQTLTFEADKEAEDVTAHFFDANGDGHLDLIIASGSIEFGAFSSFYQDRLYLNDGNGNFIKTLQYFSPTPTSFVLSQDLDQDGFADLIIGTRGIPFAYGIPAGIQIWKNDGKGSFHEITSSFGKSIQSLGMLTSGALADLDGDGKVELILAGEWTPIYVFEITKNQLIDKTAEYGLAETGGLWNCLLVEDINGDGKPDIIAGNWGLNSRLKTSADNKLQMIVNDFDQNGSLDHILISKVGTNSIPWVLKNTLVKQIPSLRKQILTYASYQNKSLEELFSGASLSKSITLQADILETSAWINEGKKKLTSIALPSDIQASTIYAVHAIKHLNGMATLVFGGNQSRIKPEIGSQMGSFGLVLIPDGKDKWKSLLPEQSGLFVPGEIRGILQITIRKKPQVIFTRNNENPLIFNIH
jgi:hypothetical protein